MNRDFYIEYLRERRALAEHARRAVLREKRRECHKPLPLKTPIRLLLRRRFGLRHYGSSADLQRHFRLIECERFAKLMQS